VSNFGFNSNAYGCGCDLQYGEGNEARGGSTAAMAMRRGKDDDCCEYANVSRLKPFPSSVINKAVPIQFSKNGGCGARFAVTDRIYPENIAYLPILAPSGTQPKRVLLQALGYC
jgi:hypothetical protein